MLFDVSDVYKFIIKNLFSKVTTADTTGETFEKLKPGVEHKDSAPPTKGEATAIRNRLPNLNNAIAMIKNCHQNGTAA